MTIVFKHLLHFLQERKHDFKLFLDFFWFYIKKKTVRAGLWFEKQKDLLVKFLLMKRGRYNRPFLHIATMGVLAIGVLVGPFLADTYPIFSGNNAQAINRLPNPAPQEQSLTSADNVFSTDISQKPRDIITEYTVQRGDTISTIAEKFQVSADTIKWANDLSDDSLSVGDVLKIPSVTGIVYKVQSGDTVYSIAKKFNTNPQKIVDFPYNEFANPETFSLVIGEMLMVPDGVQPSAQPTYQQPVYVQVPEAPQQIAGAAGWIWPIRGEITQYFTWYHTGLDIAGPAGTPIYAAKSGTVMEASCGWNYGYGCHVLLDNGGGFSTMYAHMVQQPSVSVGQSVNQGQLIGYRGSTGRSTGNHTHFEIRIGGHVVNPLGYLPQ